MTDVAFFDATCPKCERSFGWYGSLVGRPPCPKCGHQIPREDRVSAQAKLDECRKVMETSPHKAEGATLRNQRLAAGLTLWQAVKSLGVPGLTLTQLSNIEIGLEKPSPRLAEAMVKAYGLDDEEAS